MADSEQSTDQSGGEGGASGGSTIGRALAVGLTVLLIGAGAFYVHFRSVTQSVVLESEQQVAFVIPETAGWSDILDRLEDARLVERRFYFDLWARWRGLPRRVNAGHFELEGPLRWADLADNLASGGRTPDVRVTIPEGWTIFHIADRLDSRGLISRVEFLETVRDDDLLDKWELPGRSFEGYLFPDTYRFRRDARAETIVERMHQRWRTVWGEVAELHRGEMVWLRKEFELNRHDLVTVASIVEAETSVDDERPVISRVVYNRLDASMRLQMDPTCVYGAETYLEVPRPKHCKDPDNEYSTYVIDGLPPGPIANPGRASLAAAINPSDDPNASDYLFYVSRQDGTGRHHFSSSYRDHRSAIRRFLK